MCPVIVVSSKPSRTSLQLAGRRHSVYKVNPPPLIFLIKKKKKKKKEKEKKERGELELEEDMKQKDTKTRSSHL